MFEFAIYTDWDWFFFVVACGLTHLAFGAHVMLRFFQLLGYCKLNSGNVGDNQGNFLLIVVFWPFLLVLPALYWILWFVCSPRNAVNHVLNQWSDGVEWKDTRLGLHSEIKKLAKERDEVQEKLDYYEAPAPQTNGPFRSKHTKGNIRQESEQY